MAELNDKLITYGNLSTFYDKLQEQGCIEEVSELPNASENKDKLFRLDNGEKDVYTAKLLSSETITANRLPDEQQIDKAYLYEDEYYQYHYVGAYTATFSDGEVSGYGWLDYYNEQKWYLNLTEDDAEHIQRNSVFYGFTYGNGDTIDLVNKTITTQSTKNDYKSTLSDSGNFPIPAIYNAPESAQIEIAYLFDVNEEIKWFYDGTEVTITIGGEQFIGYKWLSLDSPDDYFLSDKQASNIYFVKDNESDVIYSDVKWYRVSNNVATPDGVVNLYIPQLNAPDSEQVDNAYISDDYYGGTNVYTGEETTIEVDGNNIAVYIWQHSGSDVVLYSTKPAYQIYNTDIDSNNVHFYTNDGGITELTFDNGDLLSISIVKYQRTIPPEWVWEKVATEQYVDDAIAEIPHLEAGQNIDITNNAISAKGYTYDDTIYSFAEGVTTIASEIFSHAEGNHTNASGISSHAEGGWTTAQGTYSHAEGSSTIAQNEGEHAEGNCNVSHKASDTYGNAGNTQHSVGIGSPSTHKNAFEIMQNGDMYVKGIGGYDGKHIKSETGYESTKTLQDVIGDKADKYIDETLVTGATLTVDGSQPSIVASGSTTIVWDDLASSIPSGKSVEVSVVLINTGNSALTPTMQGNYQMMGDGNLTIQASELGLYRGRYISELNKWLIEAIYQEVSGIME